MDLETALKKPRTVSELVKATGMSRGGVIQALRRNTSRVKVAGTKREHERGPESNLYTLRAGKSLAGRAAAKKSKVDPPEVLAAEAAIDALTLPVAVGTAAALPEPTLTQIESGQQSDSYPAPTADTEQNQNGTLE